MSSKKTLKYYIAQIIKDDVNTMLKEQRTMQKHENIYGQEGARKYGMKKRSVGGAGVSEFPRQCASCGKVITERYLLKALDLFWHEDCLKCGCCDCRLGEVGSTLYTKADLILCKRDYLRLFGVTGNCVACNKVIPAFEMVMKAKSFVYHLECFACQQCNHRFCVGDRFYLCDSKILCEYDYEERLVFASMAANPSGLAHIRKQVSGLQSPSEDHLSVAGAAPLKDGIELRGAAIADDGGSSGYGSPPDDNDVVCAQ